MDILERVKVVILQPLVSLAFFVAVAVFIWGIVQFISKADDPEGRETGKRHIIYGLIGLFIMVSVIGIINFIARTLGVPGV